MVSPAFGTKLAPVIINRIKELVLAPGTNTEMLWIIAPLVIVLVVMVFYFGFYKKEELGWNTALGNALVLVFVSIDLLRYIYHNPHLEAPLQVGGVYLPVKILVALIVAFEGFTLLFADFFHFLPKKVAFFISSPLPVNLTAYTAIAIVYSNVPFDRYTLLAALVVFIGLLIVLEAVKYGISLLSKEKGKG